MKLLERLRLENQIKNLVATTPTGGSPKLQQELKETKRQLNSILNKWKFGDTPISSAQEFLNNFEPWINRQIKDREELKSFLEEQGASNLTNLKETWKNTEADYLRRIEKLRESKGDDETNEELITERDELKRDKGELEQEVLDKNNKLKLKQQEVNRKETEIERLKKEKSSVEISLNNRIEELKKWEPNKTEKKVLDCIHDFFSRDSGSGQNTYLSEIRERVKNILEHDLSNKYRQIKNLLKDLILVSSERNEAERQLKELKEKYSKQGKLLDEEQTDNNKLTAKIEELENRIKELTKK